MRSPLAQPLLPNTSDILQALSGIYAAPDTPDWRERSRRLVALLMDGLRWGAPDAAAAGREQNRGA
jgi:hypothetical protein